jgi:osmotically-inducible protein OsmY
MSRFTGILRLIYMLSLPQVLFALLGGCAAMVMGERGVEGAASDFQLQAQIAQNLMVTNPVLQEGITTTVYQGRALLTGHVPTTPMRSAAADAAQKVPGVRAIYNEVEVTSPESVWDGAKDALITAQLRSNLVSDPDIRSANYTIETANGSVYLIGSARFEGELQRVTSFARYIPGVRRVVSYVELHSAPPILGQAPGVMPPVSSAGERMSRPPPQPSIEVQKL